MLDVVFVLLFIAMIIMLILSIECELTGHRYWGGVSIFIFIGISLVLSVGVLDIETFYTAYNVSSSQVESGYQSYTSQPWLSYLFQGFAIVGAIYLVTLAIEPLIVFSKKYLKRWR